MAGQNIVDEDDNQEQNAKQECAFDLAATFINSLTPDPAVCTDNKIRYIEEREYTIDFLCIDKDNQEIFVIWDRNDDSPEGYRLTGELEPIVNEAYDYVKELFSH